MNPLVKQLQQALGVTADGEYGPKTHKAVMARLGLSETVEAGGEIPDSYWPMLAKVESGNRPYVKAATSSASGLYQFICLTWLGEGGQWGPDRSKAFGGLKPTEAEQLARAKTFTQKNADALKKAGIPINRASLYAAHFLGVGTAVKLLGASDNAPAGILAGKAATAANPSILSGKTVADFKRWLQKKTGETA